MYICICKSVTDRQIREAVQLRGVESVKGLRQELGVCQQCGRCGRDAQQILRECRQQSANQAGI